MVSDKAYLPDSILPPGKAKTGLQQDIFVCHNPAKNHHNQQLRAGNENISMVRDRLTGGTRQRGMKRAPGRSKVGKPEPDQRPISIWSFMPDRERGPDTMVVVRGTTDCRLRLRLKCT